MLSCSNENVDWGSRIYFGCVRHHNNLSIINQSLIRNFDGLCCKFTMYFFSPLTDDIFQHYKTGLMLGHGSFGEVFEGIRLSDSKKVCFFIANTMICILLECTFMKNASRLFYLCTDNCTPLSPKNKNKYNLFLFVNRWHSKLWRKRKTCEKSRLYVYAASVLVFAFSLSDTVSDFD